MNAPKPRSNRPFEVDPNYLAAHLDELVEITIEDLTSAFLLLPRGDSFVEYGDFSAAYEVLKRRTDGFAAFSETSVWSALREKKQDIFVVSLVFCSLITPIVSD